MAEKYANGINQSQIANSIERFNNQNESTGVLISNFNHPSTSIIPNLPMQVEPIQQVSLTTLLNNNFYLSQAQTFTNVLPENQFLPVISAQYTESPTTSTSPQFKSNQNFTLNNDKSEITLYKSSDPDCIHYNKILDGNATQNIQNNAFKRIYNREKEKKKMLVFAILLITNLMIIVCLLFIWNIKGVSNVRVLMIFQKLKNKFYNNLLTLKI